MSGIGDTLYAVGDWFGDAYDTVSQGLGDVLDTVSHGVGAAVDLAESSLASLWSADGKPAGPLSSRPLRGGAVDRPAGGLDILPGAIELGLGAPLGATGQAKLGLQFGTGVFNPEAYGNSLDTAGDSGARPGIDVGLELPAMKTADLSFTPRIGLWSPSNQSAFEVLGGRLDTASADGRDTFSLRSDLNLPFAADVSGAMPDGYLHTTASWTHAFDKATTTSFEAADRHFDSGRDWLRLGTSTTTIVGDDTRARVGIDVVGSNIGSGDAAWRWGPRAEVSLSDPTLFGMPSLGGFAGLGFGSSPAPGASPALDQLYGNLGLDLDTPATESYLQVHGGAEWRGADLGRGVVHGAMGTGLVLTREPTEVTVGAFVDTRTALPGGDTTIGAGPAINVNWSRDSEIGLGFDLIHQALRLGVRTDF